MRRLSMLVVVCLVLLSGPVVAAPFIGPPVPKEIAHYSFWAAHREDAGDLSGWTSVYSFTDRECADAVKRTLIMAYDEGWMVNTIDPPYASIIAAFPPDAGQGRCTATLALR